MAEARAKKGKQQQQEASNSSKRQATAARGKREKQQEARGKRQRLRHRHDDRTKRQNPAAKNEVAFKPHGRQAFGGAKPARSAPRPKKSSII